MDRRALPSRAAPAAWTAPVALAALAALAGCTTLVEPPAAPAEPVTVLLVDWGWHSSLLLPRPEPGFTEYAFGEWEWFARGNDGWWRVPVVLFWPRDGALGRRDWSSLESVAASAEQSHVLLVERTASESLRERLERCFADRAASRVAGPGQRLDFVPDEGPFWLGHTCNGATAEWLRELGCEVSGLTVTARFEVEPDAAR